MDQNAVGTDAGLTGIPEFGGHHAFNGEIEIGVLKDDKRCVAAEFHGQALQRANALLCQDLADLS